MSMIERKGLMTRMMIALVGLTATVLAAGCHGAESVEPEAIAKDEAALVVVTAADLPAAAGEELVLDLDRSDYLIKASIPRDRFEHIRLREGGIASKTLDEWATLVAENDLDLRSADSDLILRGSNAEATPQESAAVAGDEQVGEAAQAMKSECVLSCDAGSCMYCCTRPLGCQIWIF
jgi:hypothetical protein